MINKCIEGGNRTSRQKQNYLHGTERYRDLKIILQDRLAKVKQSLSSQLFEEIAKPIYNSTTFIEARNNIETLVSMVEMAYGLPYKLEDSTVAINLVKAQMEQDLSQLQFVREQDRFKAMRVRVGYSKGKMLDLEMLDLELLLNKICIFFKRRHQRMSPYK